MYIYRAYGLGIHSDLPLPELVALAEAEADVFIRLGELDWSPPKNACVERLTDFTRNEAYFFWDQVGKFSARGGREIIIEPLPGVEDRLLRLPLLGPVFAVLLHQRGDLVLHASAVAIGSTGVAFVGEKGWGKSTMAAALYTHGHELMADDCVALDVSSAPHSMVMPGFPRLKLWPEAIVSTLGNDPETLPEIASGVGKRSRCVADKFALTPLPLRCVYVLGIGPELKIKRLNPQAATVRLIGASYASRFGTKLLQGETAALHLRQCATLMSKAPVYRLERPCSLSLLTAAARLVEEHLGCDT